MLGSIPFSCRVNDLEEAEKSLHHHFSDWIYYCGAMGRLERAEQFQLGAASRSLSLRLL